MAKRRRRPASTQSELPRQSSKTTDSGSLEEKIYLDSYLSNVDSTTWQDSTEEEFTVPVKMPTREEMAVRLVPEFFMDQYNEYQDDENIWHTTLGVMAGGVIGILCDWVSGKFSSITGASIAFLVMFVLIGIVAFFWLERVKKKKKAMRIKMKYRE